MGCHGCGRRQVDPESGPSAWRRAVVAGEQVLVCPSCQEGDWTAVLDRCSSCGSTSLVKRLGDVVCRGCGLVAPRGTDRAATVALPPTREALAREVAEALDRILGRD